MKRTILAAALTLMTAPAFAQDTTELAGQYVNMPEVQTMISEMFSPTAMANQVEATLPPGMVISPDQKQRIGQLMSGEMIAVRPRMEELMISGSAATFTAAELTALIDFYSSEHGAAIMGKMQPFFTSVMNQLAPEMQAMQLRLAPQLIQILQEPK